jgi:KaiC/GvpD/RAD55 family RecA-like ATPase
VEVKARKVQGGEWLEIPGDPKIENVEKIVFDSIIDVAEDEHAGRRARSVVVIDMHSTKLSARRNGGVVPGKGCGRHVDLIRRMGYIVIRADSRKIG